MRTAADAIITILQDGTIESFNPAAEQMFDHTARGILGRHVNMLIPMPYREEAATNLACFLKPFGRLHRSGRELMGQRRTAKCSPST